mgnify:CR=1 FL=1
MACTVRWNDLGFTVALVGFAVLALVPVAVKRWRARGQPWMIVADHNYGEGSAREHAALQLRLFGCAVVLARSIARIAETNLRKQGVVTLLFENEQDYERIGSGDMVETVNLADLLRPGVEDVQDVQVRVRVTKLDDDGNVREQFELPTRHSLSKTHLQWIRAGSALNDIRAKASRPPSAPSVPRSDVRAFSTCAVRRAAPPQAVPTARVAAGRPTAAASSP